MDRYEIERRAFGVGYTESAAFKDTYGGLEGMVFLECYQLLPLGVPSDTAVVFSHPIGGGAYLQILRVATQIGPYHRPVCHAGRPAYGL